MISIATCYQFHFTRDLCHLNKNFQHIRFLNMMQGSYTALVSDWDTPAPAPATCCVQGRAISFEPFSSCFMWGWTLWQEGRRAWTAGSAVGRESSSSCSRMCFPCRAPRATEGFMSLVSSSLVSQCILILHLHRKPLPGVNFFKAQRYLPKQQPYFH